MAKVTGTLLGFNDESIHSDGSIALRAKSLDGEAFDFVVTQEQIAELLPAFQSSVIKAYLDTGKPINAPTISILRCQPAFYEAQAALLAATDKIGPVALQASPSVLRAMIRGLETMIEHLERKSN